MAHSHNPTTDASAARSLESEAGSASRERADLTAVERARNLDDLEAQFNAAVARAQALVDSAGTVLCNTPPAAGSWSAAECLQHLNISADAFLPIWQQIIANAGPRKKEMNAPYRTDFWGRLFSWILEPPPRTRSKTPVPFEPVECKEIGTVLAGFVERQGRIVASLRRCRGRAIDQVKMGSPADRRIRYSIWSSFLIVAAHQRRHLWQAEQAVRSLRSVK
jgi:hypothetical protein